jgi:hypothetical protein
MPHDLTGEVGWKPGDGPPADLVIERRGVSEAGRSDGCEDERQHTAILRAFAA